MILLTHFNRGNDPADPWKFWRFIRSEMNGYTHARENSLRKKMATSCFHSPLEAVKAVITIQAQIESIGAASASDIILKISLLDALKSSQYKQFTDTLRHDDAKDFACTVKILRGAELHRQDERKSGENFQVFVTKTTAKVCEGCGKRHPGKCYHKGKTCNSCGQKGHLPWHSTCNEKEKG